MTSEVEDKLDEVRSLEKDIRKELGLLQLRLKLQSRENQPKKPGMWKTATALGIKEQITLFVMCFFLLFAASPVFRGLVIAAYRHYVLGFSLESALIINH